MKKQLAVLAVLLMSSIAFADPVDGIDPPGPQSEETLLMVEVLNSITSTSPQDLLNSHRSLTEAAQGAGLAIEQRLVMYGTGCMGGLTYMYLDGYGWFYLVNGHWYPSHYNDFYWHNPFGPWDGPFCDNWTSTL